MKLCWENCFIVNILLLDFFWNIAGIRNGFFIGIGSYTQMHYLEKDNFHMPRE